MVCCVGAFLLSAMHFETTLTLPRGPCSYEVNANTQAPCSLRSSPRIDGEESGGEARMAGALNAYEVPSKLQSRARPEPAPGDSHYKSCRAADVGRQMHCRRAAVPLKRARVALFGARIRAGQAHGARNSTHTLGLLTAPQMHCDA